jgi:hypothetical protein
MSLLSREKARQIRWKHATPHLSPEAKQPGLFRGKPRRFCLPPECADENLFEGIRKEALEYFAKHKIHWHLSPGNGLPSNHLCSSQVLMVNLLFPFIHDREALKMLFQPVYPDIDTILPIEEEGQYLAFEWTPPKDLLKEATRGSKTLRRGMANTSIDFAFLYRNQEQQTVMVLGECKYTEPVVKTSITLENASKRLEPYLELITEENSPFIIGVKDHCTLFGSDEFYQLFRQQLLSAIIEREYSERVDRVGLLYLYMPETGLQGRECRREEQYRLWRSILMEGSKFSNYVITQLVNTNRIILSQEKRRWLGYFSKRYLVKSKKL